MAEYWKSTPKYWCKFCSIYVRDTKIERTNHEATGKHQGNIQRSLRNLHRGQEREERDKQRAKDEVARLNGVVPSASSSSAAGANDPPWKRKATSSAAPAPKATVEERKRQMQQLADMGIAIPEEYRKDMALAGDWQVVSESHIEPASIKPEAVSIGVRKRKVEDEEEEDGGATAPKQPVWGSTFKTYPGSKGSDGDLDKLLSAPISTIKRETDVKAESTKTDEPLIKNEELAEEVNDAAAQIKPESKEPVKEEAEGVAVAETTPSGSGVVFKKRRKKV